MTTFTLADALRDEEKGEQATCQETVFHRSGSLSSEVQGTKEIKKNQAFLFQTSGGICLTVVKDG